MLCLYSLDKIKFFENYILGLKEEYIEETIASSTLGNIIHDALELLYKEQVGKQLNKKSLNKLKDRVNDSVLYTAEKYVNKRNLNRGKNVIIVETAKKYVERVIDLDLNELNKGNSIKIISIEKEFISILKDNLQEYKIRGKIDRIDELNGELRIIDYKTGKKLYRGNLEVKEISEIRKEKGIYNLQLLFYMIGIYKEMDAKFLKSGIISLKNINDGILEGIYEGKNSLSIENIKSYEKELIKIINEILDKDIMFEK
jgi:ATP-dependent exoDNAse (exonuclease V) beta subunit